MLGENAVNAALAQLARFIRRRRYLVLALWAIAVALLVPQACTVGNRLEAAVRMEGSPAARVEAALARDFQSRFVQRLVLVLRGLPSPDLPEGREALSEIVAAVRAVPGVAGTLSYLDSRDEIFLGREGSFLVVGLDARNVGPEARMAPLREASGAVSARLAGRFPQVELLWTGEIPLNLDVRQASSEDARSAERRALPIALLLLLAAFGSVVAALLPVAVGVLGVFLTLGVAALAARSFHLSIFVQNIASMIGLGIGIDYALLMVSRFRESLARKHSPGLAVEDSCPRAGQTLLLSALPVGIGFAALLTMPGDFRSIGFGGMLVTFFTLLLALTMLPALLAALGKRVDAGRIMSRSAAHHEEGSQRWRRWGTRVVRHPWLALAARWAAHGPPRAAGVAPADRSRARRLAALEPGVGARRAEARGHGARQRRADAPGDADAADECAGRESRGLDRGAPAVAGLRARPADRARALGGERGRGRDHARAPPGARRGRVDLERRAVRPLRAAARRHLERCDEAARRRGGAVAVDPGLRPRAPHGRAGQHALRGRAAGDQFAVRGRDLGPPPRRSSDWSW